MAKKTKSFSEMYGMTAKKAVNSAKAKEVVQVGGGGLPAGIEGGVAQLSSAKIDTYASGNHQGKHYFSAQGVCKLPKEFKGQITEGGQTRIMEPLCETPERTGDKSRKTLGDHVDWVVNQLKLLIGEEAVDECDTLEEMIDVTNQLSPHFKFRTWIGEKATSGPFKDREPQVQHVWMNSIEFEEDGDTEDDVEEDTEEVEDDEFEDETDEDVEIEDNEEDEEGDSEKEEEESEEAEEEDEDWQPEKDDIYSYKPPRSKKPIDVQVVTVATTRRTTTVKAVESGKIYKGVPWDKLED